MRRARRSAGACSLRRSSLLVARSARGASSTRVSLFFRKSGGTRAMRRWSGAFSCGPAGCISDSNGAAYITSSTASREQHASARFTGVSYVLRWLSWTVSSSVPLPAYSRSKISSVPLLSTQPCVAARWKSSLECLNCRLEIFEVADNGTLSFAPAMWCD